MITNGMVAFEDGTKAVEEYAPARKVRVELHFTVDEGMDYGVFLDDAAIAARAKVEELLGKKSTAFMKGEAAIKAAVAENRAAIDALVAEKKKPGRKPKAAVEDDTDAIGGDASKGEPADQITGGLEDAEPAQTVNLSDKGLYDVVKAVNAKIRKPAEITAIVGKYCPNDGVPPSVRRIPEGKRTAFLADLNKYADSFAK